MWRESDTPEHLSVPVGPCQIAGDVLTKHDNNQYRLLLLHEIKHYTRLRAGGGYHQGAHQLHYNKVPFINTTSLLD